MAGGYALFGRSGRVYLMSHSRLDELFPQSAEKFDCSVAGYSRVEREWMEHGWQGDFYLHIVSDDLLVRCASWRQRDNLFFSYSFNLLLWQFRTRYANMAGRKAREASGKRPEWQGFIDFRLSAEELYALDEWQPAVVEIWEAVDTLMQNKYRLTLSYNSDTKVASCTIMDDDPARSSAGYGLSSSDVDGAGALKAAIFKHFTVLEGSWARLLEQPLKRGTRG